MAEDPIQTHPFFDTLKTRYAWDAAKEQFAETLPESSGEQTALSGSGKKPKKNPLFGVDNWLVVGAVFRKTYARKDDPVRPSCAASARSWTSRRASSSSRFPARRRNGTG